LGFLGRAAMRTRKPTVLLFALLLVAASSCGGSEPVQPTESSASVTAELRPSSDNCVELIVEATSVFRGCASEFQAGPQVVFLDLVNSLYVVYVGEGSVLGGDGYKALQSQGPFSLVTLVDKDRTIYEVDFNVERNGRQVKCVHIGVIGLLECG
jgi:hypothetical protein